MNSLKRYSAVDLYTDPPTFSEVDRISTSSFVFNDDGRMRLLSHQIKGEVDNAFDSRYKYDAQGNIEKLISTTDPAINRIKHYDSQGQLTETVEVGGQGNPLESFAYDLSGNRVGDIEPHNRIRYDGSNQYDGYDLEGNVLGRTTYEEIVGLRLNVEEAISSWNNAEEETNEIGLTSGNYRFRIEPIRIVSESAPGSVTVTVQLRDEHIVFPADIRFESQFTLPLTLVPGSTNQYVTTGHTLQVPLLVTGDSKLGLSFNIPAGSGTIATTAHIDKLDRIFGYSYDYLNRMVHAEVRDKPEPNGVERNLYAIDYFYDVLGNRIARYRDSNPAYIFTGADEKEYIFAEAGKEIIVADDQAKIMEHQFTAPSVDQVLMIDDFDYLPNPDPQIPEPVTALQAIIPFTDHQRSVAYLYSPEGPPGQDPDSRQSINYSSFGIPNDGAVETNENGITDVFDLRYNGWKFDLEADLYFIGTQAYDANSSRLLSENTSIMAGMNRYTLGGNNPDQHRSGSSNLGVKSDNLGPGFWHDFQYYLNPGNNWSDGNYAFAIAQYGAMAVAAVAGTAALAIVGPAAAAGSVVSYASSAIGTSIATYGGGLVAAGATAGAADATLSMVATGQFDGLNLIASTVGGGLNPVNGFGGLGSGLAGAYTEFATTGELSGRGYQLGSIVGGVVTGGVDDFVMSGKKFAAAARAAGEVAGSVTGKAAWHATKRVGVEGGFTVAGGAIGYANGGMDGLLLGAGIGQSVGSIVGNLRVTCFTGKTPILTSVDGTSKPVEDIREGELLLARDEHNADGPLELKRVEEVFTRSAHVIELVVRGRIIGTTPEHPFYVARLKRFVPAGHLEIGEAFLSHDGQHVILEGVRDTGKIETVYNFRIADHHTYFVGGCEWGFSVWVHNANNAYRGDDAPNSPVSPKNGLNKPYVDAGGNLRPASLTGSYKDRTVSIGEHVLGGFRGPQKSNSPFISLTPDKIVASGYGSSTVTVDLKRLRAAIRSGAVSGITVYTPSQVRRAIQSDPNLTDYWKNLATSWSRRDGEYLIRGVVPAQFVKVAPT